MRKARAPTPIVPSSRRPSGADHGAVIAETHAHVDVLTVGEAVMRLDLSNAPVLMFRDRSTKRMNVVYRRADGHVGWIDPGEE